MPPRELPARGWLHVDSWAGLSKVAIVVESETPKRRTGDGGRWPPVSAVRGVDDGPRERLDGRRIAALGNAVVAPVAEVVGRRVIELLSGRAA